MDHYYSNDPKVESRPETWTAEIAGKSYTFTSDAGVFSKGAIDFGSQLLIETIIDQSPLDGDFLDVGCGYGPIGLVLGDTFQDVQGQMVDVNERALALAEENLAANQVTNVRVYASDRYSAVEKEDFSTIVSNPPIRAGKKIVHDIIEGSKAHLKEGGQFLIVIQKKQGAPSAKKKMEEVFGNVSRIGLDRGYWILKSVKE